MSKEQALSAVSKMPDNFDVDELLERLVLLDSVEKALKEVDEGKGIPHEEVVKQFQQWRESRGLQPL